MVGRGWWVLVWTICAGCTVCVVSGGVTCEPGQEFFNGQQGQCVPCTRCHDPQVVVAPCYEYQDAVCAPAAQFVPNWSQPGRPQPPITLSTSPAPHAGGAHTHGRHKAGTPTEGRTQSEKTPDNQGKPQSNRSASRDNIVHTQGDATLLAQNDSKKTSKKHPRHHLHRQHRQHHHNHHHRHRQDVRPQNRSGEPQVEESKVNSVIIVEDSGANSGVDPLDPLDPLDPVASSGEAGEAGVPSGHNDGVESASRDVSSGAKRSDETEETEEGDVEEPEAGGWKETFFFAIIIVISVCLVLLTVVTLSHLRSRLTRRKLKRVYDGLPPDNGGEARVMEQLLPSASDGAAPVVATRGAVTYIRAATTTSSTPSSPTITTTAAMSVEAQPTSGHVYPINPFTMDRLLEQRRVLGPASSVDTNLYIESWQQQDSLPAGHTAHILPGQCLPLRGSVSACPSPAPVRSYRPGPASASASPTVSIRGLNITRGPVRGGLGPPPCVVSGGGAEWCS